MSPLDLLLIAAPVTPFVMAVLCAKPAFRRLAPHLLILAPLPGLGAALLVPRGLEVVAAPAPFRITLALDGAGALLLGVAAVLWMAAGSYAARYLAKDPGCSRFAVWWLLTLAGSFGVFVVADVASFYLAFSLVSLAAYGLAAHEDTPEARRAGIVYLALTLISEGLLIAGLVMLASGSPEPNPLIRDAVAGLAASPWKGAILALLMTGFAVKMGLVPLHVWMPLAHAVAPVPGSAALSGIVVKAGVIGMIRFLPAGTALPGWGEALMVAGILTAYYGVAVGLTQRHPKRVLAYSTVSQMGVVGAVLGAGAVAGDSAAPLLGAFYAANHILLKGAMFLTVGVAAYAAPRRIGAVCAVAALLGLSLAGLPFTGGALAKIAIKGPMGSGAAGFLLTLSAAGTTLLMARFVWLLKDAAGPADATPPLGVLGPWIVLTALAVVVPSMLFTPVTGLPPSAAIAPGDLLKLLWPIALGLAAAWGLHRAGPPLPEIPAGDILALAGRVEGPTRLIARAADLLDGALRSWPVAAGLLAAFVLLAALRLAAAG